MPFDEKKKETPRTLIENSLLFSEVSLTVRLRRTPQRLQREKQHVDIEDVSNNSFQQVTGTESRPTKKETSITTSSTVQNSNGSEMMVADQEQKRPTLLATNNFTRKKRKSGEMDEEVDATPRTLLERMISTNEIVETVRVDTTVPVRAKIRPVEKLTVQENVASESPTTQIRKAVLQNVQTNREKFRKMPPRKKKRLSQLPLNKTIEPEVAEFAEKLSQNIPKNPIDKTPQMSSPQFKMTPNYEELFQNQHKKIRAKRRSLDSNLNIEQTPSTENFFMNLLARLPKEVQEESLKLETEIESENLQQRSMTSQQKLNPDENLSESSQSHQGNDEQSQLKSERIADSPITISQAQEYDSANKSVAENNDVSSVHVNANSAIKSALENIVDKIQEDDFSVKGAHENIAESSSMHLNADDSTKFISKTENDESSFGKGHSTMLATAQRDKEISTNESIRINRAELVASTPRQVKVESVNEQKKFPVDITPDVSVRHIGTETVDIPGTPSETFAEAGKDESKAGVSSVTLQTVGLAGGLETSEVEMEDDAVKHSAIATEQPLDVEPSPEDDVISESEVDVDDEEILESEEENEREKPRKSEFFTLQTPKVGAGAFNKFQNILARYLDKVPQEQPKTPAPVIKKVVKKKPILPCSSSQFKSMLQHHCSSRITPGGVAYMEKLAELYMKNTSKDLDRICEESGKKIITQEHVETLMKYRGHITKDKPLRVLIEENLPMEYREVLIPIAMPGNKVFPEKCLLSKEH